MLHLRSSRSCSLPLCSGLRLYGGVTATGAALALSPLLLLPAHLLVLRSRTGLDPRLLLRPCFRIIAAGAVPAALVSLARIAVLQAHPLLPLALLATLG